MDTLRIPLISWTCCSASSAIKAHLFRGIQKSFPRTITITTTTNNMLQKEQNISRMKIVLKVTKSLLYRFLVKLHGNVWPCTFVAFCYLAWSCTCMAIYGLIGPIITFLLCFMTFYCKIQIWLDLYRLFSGSYIQIHLILFHYKNFPAWKSPIAFLGFVDQRFVA